MNYNGWKFVDFSVAVFQSSKMASFDDIFADSDSAADFESDSADDSVSDMETSGEEEEAVIPHIPDDVRRRRLEEWEEMFGSSDSEEEFIGFEADELNELPRAAVRPQPLNFRTSYECAWLKDFDEATGIKFDTDGMTEAEVFMKLLGGEETVVRLVTKTNRYARQYIQTVGIENLRQHSLANSWTDTNVPEMKAFLSILLLMGFVKFPSYQDYWSTENVIQMSGFRSIMPRNRFKAILQFFHVANNEDALPVNHPNHDKLFKIRPVIETLVSAWQDAYYPGKHLSVDESIIAFKGKCSWVVYKPQKPHKWGMNAWVLTDATNGYVYNWSLYTGKSVNEEPQADVGLTHRVVTDLVDVVYDKGHIIYMDNYFSSPALFDELADNQTGACGTLRTNRRGVPDAVKSAKLKKGDPHLAVRDEKKLFIAWYDRRQVNLLTTVHNDRLFAKEVRCKDPRNNNRRVVQKPMAIELYTKYMGGVDMLDRQIWTYLQTHSCLKWWKKLFMYLLEVTYCQFKVIWLMQHPEQRRSTSKLRCKLINGLLDGFSSNSKVGRPSLERLGRLTERHFPGLNPARTKAGKQSKPDCIVCSNRNVHGGRHQTEYICKQCNEPMHLTICFERYHTLRDYKLNQ